MEAKLKVTLTDGKQVSIKRLGYVLKVWNGGQWDNIAAFEPEDYEKAEENYQKYKDRGWRYVELCQLF